MEKEETIERLCVVVEDFLLETGQQDVEQDFDAFIKWLRLKHYKRFLQPQEPIKE